MKTTHHILKALSLGMLIGFTFPVFAQDPLPLGEIASFEAGEFSLLATTTVSERLLVADDANDEIRIFDISNPSQPRLVTTVPLEGSPRSIAGGDEFGLVVVEIDDQAILQVIFPSGGRREVWEGIPLIDLPTADLDLTINAESTWGLLANTSTIGILEIVAFDNINSRFERLQSTATGLFQDHVFSAQPSGEVSIFALSAGPDWDETEEIDFEGEINNFNFSAEHDLGIALMDDSIVLFSLSNANILSQFDLDTAYSSTAFIESDDEQWLSLLSARGNELRLLDITNPDEIVDLGTRTLDVPIRDWVTYHELFITTNGQQVNFLAANP